MANSTLVTVATTPLASDLSQANRLVAMLVHGCLFQQQTLITDAHLVNNPTLRVAIRRYPALAEILDAGGCRIHRRNGMPSLAALHRQLEAAGAFHNEHDRDAFNDIAALSPFDALPVEPWDPKEAGRHFAEGLLYVLGKSDADTLLATAIPDAKERRAAKQILIKVLKRIQRHNHGILRQRDLEQAMQPEQIRFASELEAASPGLLAKIAAPFYEIERAMYDVSVPLSSGHALTFSQYHKTAARLAGRPRGFFQPTDNLYLAEISCEFLNEPNLLALSARDMTEIRTIGGAAWTAAVDAYKKIPEPSSADRTLLKTELSNYIRYLDGFFQSHIRRNSHRTIGQKLKLDLLGVAARTGKVIEAAAAHATDPLVDLALAVTGVSGLEVRLSLGDSLDQMKKQIKSAAAYAAATVELRRRHELLAFGGEGKQIVSGISFDDPPEVAYF